MREELDIKVGDKVVLISSSFSIHQKEIATVIKITPTGRIRIDARPDTQYDKYGHSMGNAEFSYSRIEKLTPEIQEEIRQGQVIRYCKEKLRTIKIDYKTAAKLLEVLEECQE